MEGFFSHWRAFFYLTVQRKYEEVRTEPMRGQGDFQWIATH